MKLGKWLKTLPLRRAEGGQIGFAFLMSFFIIFVFFDLAFDAVVWARLVNLSGVKGIAAATAKLEQLRLRYSIMSMDEHDCRTLDVGGGSIVQLPNGGSYTRSDCAASSQEGLRVSSTLSASGP